MSELLFEELTMPACSFSSKDNPWAVYHPPTTISWPVELGKSIPVEERKYFNYQCDTGCLPYRLQDDYDRDRKPRDFKVAVLENEFLKATFLLEFGGRLWSLIHKPSNKELLYVNPVFQAGNLALRNAWFSGGVEWNMGMPGHNPFTCAAPFIAKLTDADGTPVLRMYEWERVRSAPYQVDFYLPDGSEFLLVRAQLINPHDRDIAVYWWSNIAVPETSDLRVLAPATSAFCDKNEATKVSISLDPVPIHDDVDISYPMNNYGSHDYFFNIPDGQRPWEAALYGDGGGLIHASTRQLKGRKLFVWGTGPGGQRWQEFLSEPGYPYVEVQAGLAHTQYECLLLPAHGKFEWIEAYGCMEADPKAVHSPDWDKACSEVQDRLDKALPMNGLEDELKRSEQFSRQSPTEIIQHGQGWGALEIERLKKAGVDVSGLESMPFGEVLLEGEQQPWLSLLRDGRLPEQSSQKGPGGYMVQDEWAEMLVDSVEKGDSDHWFGWYHLGVVEYSRKNFAAARKAWRTSVSKQPNAWAYRDLAILCQDEKSNDEAIEMFAKAWAIDGESARLAVEYGNALNDSGDFDGLEEFLNTLSDKVTIHPRIQILKVKLFIHKCLWDQAEALIEDIVVPDIREIDFTLSDMWYLIQENKLAVKQNKEVDDEIKAYVKKNLTLPHKIDFRTFYD